MEPIVDETVGSGLFEQGVGGVLERLNGYGILSSMRDCRAL